MKQKKPLTPRQIVEAQGFSQPTFGMTEGEITLLRKEFSMEPNDIIHDATKNLWLVSRKGVLKIIWARELNVRKKVHICMDGFAVVTRVTNKIGLHAYTEATGEASSKNCTFKFPLAVAEKRSEARAVLTHIGVYHRGVIGEIELEEETEIAAVLDKRKGQVNQAVDDLKKAIA